MKRDKVLEHFRAETNLIRVGRGGHARRQRAGFGTRIAKQRQAALRVKGAENLLGHSGCQAGVARDRRWLERRIDSL